MVETITMKAVAMTFYTGETSVIEVEKPKVDEPTDVVIQVQYSALDTATKQVVDKTFAGFFTHSRAKPLIVGWHYAGTVVALGSKVEHLTTGDQVWGFLEYNPQQKQGSFSEFVRVHADHCARIPDGVDAKLAAAAATETLTALQAMRDYGNLKESQSILVLGAGGGVGSAAVGIAKRLGAQVTAVCSAKDIQRVKNLGADVVLDRAQVDVFSAEDNPPKLYDLIFDTPAKYSALQCFKHLNPKGSYVTTLPSFSLVAGKFVSLFNGKTSAFVECAPQRKDLELVGEWLADGLIVEIDSTFPIRDMQSALARHGDSSKVGRVVIEVSGGW